MTQPTRPQALGLLGELRERGLVEARGGGRGRSYHLSASVYRQLGRSVAYQRIRGLESEQQRQLVLGHVRAHGSVTRGEVAELCSLAPRQASHLLARMVVDGPLEQQGERRWTRYVRRGPGDPLET